MSLWGWYQRNDRSPGRRWVLILSRNEGGGNVNKPPEVEARMAYKAIMDVHSEVTTIPDGGFAVNRAKMERKLREAAQALEYVIRVEYDPETAASRALGIPSGR